MFKLWGRTNSINVQKAMWTVGELGLPHKRHDVGGPFGQLDTPDYIAKNPNQRIPTIDDGGTIVWESNAVVRYLAARYGAGTLWPTDPAARSEADRWMDWQQTTLTADMVVVFWGLIRTPADKRDMKAIEAAAQKMHQSWRILEGHMAERAYVGGDSFTMGDIPVGCFYWRYVNLPIPRPDFPNLDDWHKRLQGRAAFTKHVMLPLT